MVGAGTRMRKYSVGWGAQVKSKSQHRVVWKNGLGEFGKVKLFLHATTFYTSGYYPPLASMPKASKTPALHQPTLKASTWVKASMAGEVKEVPSSSNPPILSQRASTCSQVPPHINSAVIDGYRSGTLSDISSTHNNPLTNPATPPVTPNLICPETHTSNKNQHPGQIHDPYAIKRHTKEEMKEVCHLKAEMKAKKVEEVERWGAKQKESMRHIAEYEEELENTNINDMPIPAGKPSVYSEATPVPQKQHLQHTYALLDMSLGKG